MIYISVKLFIKQNKTKNQNIAYSTLVSVLPTGKCPLLFRSPWELLKGSRMRLPLPSSTHSVSPPLLSSPAPGRLHGPGPVLGSHRPTSGFFFYDVFVPRRSLGFLCRQILGRLALLFPGGAQACRVWGDTGTPCMDFLSPLGPCS